MASKSIKGRDSFGNPIYGKTFDSSTAKDMSTFLLGQLKEDGLLDTDESRTAFIGAFGDRWFYYGMNPDPTKEWTGDDTDDWNLIIGQWVPSFERFVRTLWRRYASIVEAYKTKISWADGIVNTTTYKDLKDTSSTNGDSTDWALPNKKVESPYGTPTSHSENNGGSTSTKTGAVETKGMLNPVAQRDLYARLLRDAWGDMAEECSPLFNQMHL